MLPVVTVIWVGVVTVLWVGLVAAVWALVSGHDGYASEPPGVAPEE